MEFTGLFMDQRLMTSTKDARINSHTRCCILPKGDMKIDVENLGIPAQSTVN